MAGKCQNLCQNRTDDKGNAADEIVARRAWEIRFMMSVSDATNMNTLQIRAPKKSNINHPTTPMTWSYTTFDEWQALMTKGIKNPAIQLNGAPKHTNTNNSEACAAYYTFDEWKALMAKWTKTSVDQHSQGKTQAVLLAEEAVIAAAPAVEAAVDEALKLLDASEKLVQAARDWLSLAKTWLAVPELKGEL